MIVQPAYVGARGVVVIGAAARYGGSGARLLPPSCRRECAERASGRASASEPTVAGPPHGYALLDV